MLIKLNLQRFASFKFKHWYANDTKIGTGTYKFKHFSIIEPLPQLDQVTGVEINGTTLSWNAVENAESYDIYADDMLIGNTTGGGRTSLSLPQMTDMTVDDNWQLQQTTIQVDSSIKTAIETFNESDMTNTDFNNFIDAVINLTSDETEKEVLNDLKEQIEGTKFITPIGIHPVAVKSITPDDGEYLISITSDDFAGESDLQVMIYDYVANTLERKDTYEYDPESGMLEVYISKANGDLLLMPFMNNDVQTHTLTWDSRPYQISINDTIVKQEADGEGSYTFNSGDTITISNQFSVGEITVNGTACTEGTTLNLSNQDITVSGHFPGASGFQVTINT